jgi:hypothetical protein
VLPDLIVDVQAAQRGLAHASSSDDRREVERISADLFFLLRTVTKRIGRTDLSLLVADRVVLAAEAADDPIRMAAAKWNLGHILLAQGETDGAEEFLCASVLHFVPDDDQPRGIVAALRWRMTPGSYLVISHVATDGVSKDVLSAIGDV